MQSFFLVMTMVKKWAHGETCLVEFNLVLIFSDGETGAKLDAWARGEAAAAGGIRRAGEIRLRHRLYQRRRFLHATLRLINSATGPYVFSPFDR